jgi:hypothetical protein
MNHRSINCLEILVWVCAACLAAGCSVLSQAAAEKYIKDSAAQWAESVATGDASVLKRILADDFVWIYPNGTRILWTKAEAVADAAAGPGDFVSDHVDDVHVRFFGSTALAQGSESWAQRSKSGKVTRGQFVWSDLWLRRHGQWQLAQGRDEAIGVQESKPDAH